MEQKILFNDCFDKGFGGRSARDKEIRRRMELNKIFPIPNPTLCNLNVNQEYTEVVFSYKNIDCRNYIKCLGYVVLKSPEWIDFKCNRCWWQNNKDRKITKDIPIKEI
jgi:hypothetical protein